MSDTHVIAPKWKPYLPLIVIVLVTLLAAVALTQSGVPFMQGFMGWFLVTFAMFKCFDLQGFAKGFRQYDLIAMRWPGYALAYPFLELALGLAYLASFLPVLTNLLTLYLMVVSGAGVIRSIASGRKVDCACLGTLLSVPLSVVSIVENIGMALMALGMLYLMH